MRLWFYIALLFILSSIVQAENATVNGSSNISSDTFKVNLYVTANESENVSTDPADIATVNLSIAAWWGEGAPIEHTSVLLFANITNMGAANMTEPFVVRFVQDSIDGPQIGDIYMVEPLASGQSASINRSYLLRYGSNTIFLVVDAYRASATYAKDVPIYAYYRGTVNFNVALPAAQLFFHDAVSHSPLETIYFADADSNFSVHNLQAIGYDRFGNPVGDDFTDIDVVLHTSSCSDSVKTMWGGGIDLPLQTESFNIAGQYLSSVPVIPSMARPEFRTGIVWDTADDTGNGQYDAIDGEDLVFVTKVVRLPEITGSYMYESRVPAMLSRYRNGQDTLMIYTQKFD